MADIKFHCPECQQKIAADGSAGGMQLDCPNCRSTLVMPVDSSAAVTFVARRSLVAHATSTDSAYEELERKHKELALALDESAKLRADTERSRAEVIKLRGDLEA